MNEYLPEWSIVSLLHVEPPANSSLLFALLTLRGYFGWGGGVKKTNSNSCILIKMPWNRAKTPQTEQKCSLPRGRVLYCQVEVCNSKSVAEWTQIGGSTMAQTHCWLDADQGASERKGRSITFCLVFKLLRRRKMKLGASLCFHSIRNRIKEPSWDRI